MIGEGWVTDLTAVASNGNVTQVYPSWASAGVARAAATVGQLIREPVGGSCSGLQIETDGVNGGTLELWDVNGHDIGADVSSLTVITNAQLTTMISRGDAKLIHKQNFIASPETPVNIGPFSFVKGLAARFSNSGPSGSCSINLKVAGGVRKTEFK
jgi:hypothetical protein